MFTNAIVLDYKDFWDLVSDFAADFVDDVMDSSQDSGDRMSEDMVRGYFAGRFNRLLDKERVDEMVVFVDDKGTNAMRITDGDDFVEKVLDYFGFASLRDIIELGVGKSTD
jgi:hypothetical protein